MEAPSAITQSIGFSLQKGVNLCGRLRRFLIRLSPDQ